jgi:hypothetical protein
MKSRLRARLSRRVILLVSAVLQKQPQEFGSLGVGGTGTVRTANTGARQRTQKRVNRKIVQFEIFLRRSFPIPNVGFVPYFPEPCLYLGIAVALQQMAGKLKDQPRPLLVVLWWMRPSGEDFAVREIVAILFWMSGEHLRHEANFHQWLDASVVKSIKNPIQDGPAVD